jgi:tRNA pseudouridine13 synthase
VSTSLPYLTADVPGTGGTLRASPEDFVVEEIAAYPPAGHGDHVLVWIEKRGWTTPAAATALAGAVGADPGGVGWAGMKDRHAVTRQWLSLPPPTTPEQVAAAAVDGVAVLTAARHPHKLRTGHLRGNRFAVTVRGAVPGAADRARTILGRLAAPPGAPNWFGEQRFGATGDNVERGLALLAGARVRAPPKLRRLLISAVQSQLFNDWLAARVRDGLFPQVIDGDLLVKRAGSAPFRAEAPAVEADRVHAGEVVVTGPMFGPRMRAAAAGTAAAAREGAVLAAAGLTIETFAAAGKLAEGTRRALAVPIADPEVVEVDATAITLRFALPAGAYATAVVREVTKDGGRDDSR